MKKDYSLFSYLLMTALVCISVGILMWISVKSYDVTTERQKNNDHRRAVLSYISTKAHQFDSTASVYLDQDTLVLVEKIDDMEFENRIYVYEGALMEQYILAGNDFDPQDGQVIASECVIHFQKVNSQLLNVESSDGEIYVSFVSREAIR